MGGGAARARALPAAVIALALVASGCGAGAAATHAATGSSASAARRRAPNPAQVAALDVARLQPVVPFSKAQVAQLLPVLQSLEADPQQPAATLAADGQKIEAVFTAEQREALKNMGSATGGAFFGGSAGPRGRFSGVRPGASRSRSGPRAGPGGGSRAGEAFAYQLAIDALEGKTPAFGPGAGPSGSSAGAATA